MIIEKQIKANGISQHFRFRDGGKNHVLFIHGNASDSVFWTEVIKALPAKYTAIAPDLRGYGHTEPALVDSTKSYDDFVDDILGLVEALGIESYHVVAHSLGGGIGWELLIKDAHRIKSMTQVNPASPFGFGGTKDIKGTLTFADGEGSGGGTINPDFVKLIEQEDRSTDHQASPLNIMNAFYWEPPFVPANVMELLEGLLRIQTGDSFYPGDFTPSENYPFTCPGKKGAINSASPTTKREILAKLSAIENGPEILWIRGAKDKIVSNESLFDTAVLGKMGAIPNYPGEEICPPQPMVDQTRYCLEHYGQNGNKYKEVVFENAGHTPYIEEHDRFINELLSILE